MRARVKKKIRKRFLWIDALISACFSSNWQLNYPTIKSLRWEIQYWRRRYPTIYRDTFHTDGDLGHFNAR